MLPVRFSHLKAVARAPVFAEHALGGGEDAEETTSMERGSALHALVFGTREVTFFPGAARRGKEWDTFKAARPDAHILTEKEFAKTAAMAASVKRNGRAMELLKGPGVVNEHTLLAKLQGRECRATPDARGPEGIPDLKSCRDAGPIPFFYAVKRMGYHVQLAWYQRIAKAAGVPAGPGRFFVAVESVAPFVTQVYRLPPELVEEGDKLATLWFEQLLNCERSGAFPGYGPDEMLLEQPFADNGLVWGEDSDEAAA